MCFMYLKIVILRAHARTCARAPEILFYIVHTMFEYAPLNSLTPKTPNLTLRLYKYAQQDK